MGPPWGRKNRSVTTSATSYSGYMTDPMDQAPPSPLTFEEEEEIKRISRLAHEVHRQANPSPLVGHATEHSIEDPFTGQITVQVRI